MKSESERGCFFYYYWKICFHSTEIGRQQGHSTSWKANNKSTTRFFLTVPCSVSISMLLFFAGGPSLLLALVWVLDEWPWRAHFTGLSNIYTYIFN